MLPEKENINIETQIKRSKNIKTNSYYTEEEHEKLTSFGFKWSNRSNRYNDNFDNCLYSFDKFNKTDIEIRENGTFNLEIYSLSLFGHKKRYEKINDFLKVIEILNKNRKIKLNQYILMLLLNLFYMIYISYAVPFYLLMNLNKLKESLNNIKISYPKNYYDFKDIYQPAIIFYSCIIIFILGISTRYI